MGRWAKAPAEKFCGIEKNVEASQVAGEFPTQYQK